MPAVTGACKCGRQWTGLAEAHCPTCHEHFSTVANFDRHRPGKGGCQPPSLMRGRDGDLVFRPSRGPYGITWRQNVDRRDQAGQT
jgi:hypothetical protein